MNHQKDTQTWTRQINEKLTMLELARQALAAAEKDLTDKIRECQHDGYEVTRMNPREVLVLPLDLPF